MRRADRLFELIQLLRGRRLSTAQYLAEKLEVSPRTVYRDIADLKLQGLPIEGEAGVGYRMGAGFDLAPLMFSIPEAEALIASVRLAQPRLDEALAFEAERGLSKILAVLPELSRRTAERVGLYSPPIPISRELSQHLSQLRKAASRKQKVHVVYADQTERVSERVLRPLGCFYWGAVWTLAAYCELRTAFRHFRIDRIRELSLRDAYFEDEDGKTLEDMRRLATDRQAE
jgi:predicted DNA-binding transcriptional regulator YafY